MRKITSAIPPASPWGVSRRSAYASAAGFALVVALSLGGLVYVVLNRQKLELVGAFRQTRFISPNGDGVRDIARLGVRLNGREVVDLDIVEPSGRLVVRLVDRERIQAYGRVRARWDGRRANGEPVRDGSYRAILRLKEAQRTVQFPRALIVDTGRPEPEVTGVFPRRSGRVVPSRELLGCARFVGPRRGEVALLVARIGSPHSTPVRRGSARRGFICWDGSIDGHAAPPGRYRIAVEVRDAAGNLGRSKMTAGRRVFVINR